MQQRTSHSLIYTNISLLDTYIMQIAPFNVGRRFEAGKKSSLSECSVVAHCCRTHRAQRGGAVRATHRQQVCTQFNPGTCAVRFRLLM